MENHFNYDKNNKNIEKFSIDVIQQNMGILIQCNYLDGIKYSSVFNLQKLKKIDKIFGGSPPPSISDIYETLCRYFNDNDVFIKEVNNSKIIIEIDKDFKPNMKFEIERDQNNNNESQKNIKINNKDINNQNMSIIYNNKENIMNNNNNKNDDNNITNKMIKDLNNEPNNEIILNPNMNNNGGVNKNNMNIIGIMNNINGNMNNNQNFSGNTIINNDNTSNNHKMSNIISLNGNNNNNYNKYYNMNYITDNNYNNNKHYNMNYIYDNNNMNHYSKINSKSYYNNNNYNSINNNINFNYNNNNYRINNNNNNYNNNNNLNDNNYNITNNNNYNYNYNNNYNINFKNNNNKKNEIIKKMLNDNTYPEQEDNLGGVNNININNENSNNNNNYNYKNNFPFYKFINCNKNLHLDKKKNQFSSSLIVRIAQPENNQKVERETTELKSFLKFLLIKKIANKVENISDYGNLKDVLKLIKNNQNFKENINSKNAANILDYLKYLDNISLNIGDLYENLYKEREELRKEIVNYWKYLTKYAKYNNDFQQKLFEDLKSCHLDYSIVNINIMERDNPEEYEQKKRECKNMKKMILYFLSEINPDSNKLNIELEYSNKSINGIGFYFSDSIDYIIRSQNNEKTPQINDTFPLLVCEIFYDEEKLKQTDFDISLSLSDSSQKNSLNNQDIIEPDGLKKIEIFNLNDNDIKRIKYTEYVVSEKYQIFPLYTFTLRRNKFLILYRDPNFIGKDHYSKDLKELILKSLNYSNNKNFYFISSTEEALKLLLKKKNENVILITSIGKDKSGKRFVEIARKISPCDDLIVLFFSNNTKHFEWITNFSNCLYTSETNIYEEYITNYNYDGLKELKKKVENSYGITLKNLTFYFLNHESDYIDDDNNKCEYFRSVYIFNPESKLYLLMTKEGKVKKSKEKCIWEITLVRYDITFRSNGFYLDIDENKNIVVGSKEMKIWDFNKIVEKDSEVVKYYFFINIEKEKNFYLSMEDDEDIRVNKEYVSKNSDFELNDI